MSQEVNKGFVCIWKIRHFNFYDSESDHCISTPVFTTDSIEGKKWILHLFHDRNEVGCYLTLEGSRKLDIPINFRCELRNFDGEILKASEQLSCNFVGSKFLEKIVLVERDELLRKISSCWKDEVTLFCFMDYSDENKLPVSTCQVTMDFSERFSFLWPFDCSNELVKKQIVLAEIPVEITFQYIDNTVLFNFLSVVKDCDYFFVWFQLSLVDGRDFKLMSIRRFCEFSKTNMNEKCAINVSKQTLKIRDELKIKCEILNSFKSLMTYDKICLEKDLKSQESAKMTSTERIVTFHEKDPQQFQEKQDFKTGDDCLYSLQKHLRNMFSDAKFTDVTLRVGDHTFCVHKSLLAARSPVFSAMFDQDMLESNTGIVDITDVDADSLKSFLEYIYTGTIEDMNYDVALNLLATADKYEVTPLNRKCSNFLKSALSQSNVCEILSIAEMFNCEGLKSFAIDYIVVNSTTILSSPEWAQWLKANTTLASEVFLKMSRKFDGAI